ncbi:hypothetical protein V9T40_005978 [Parthenolecanium corni]|uniref:Aminotransferase class I/classII large domain-containing protein n=1 Tax=Parthenolecanium corni TaxID=536013 RepID=A0AAN9TTV7_9HEMI
MVGHNHSNNQCARNTINDGPVTNLDYNFFINSASRRYRQSPLREIADIFDSLPEGKVNIALGFPNAATFAFQNINVTLKNGLSLTLKGVTLNKALQYGSSQGNSDFVNWLKQFQDRFHGPLVWKAYDVIPSSGSQEAISLIVSTILESDDVVIIQTPTYPGVLSLLKPKNIEMIPLHTDIEGVQIESLRQILKERSISGKSMPKLIIVNSTGGNPSGITISEKEKKDIYQLACKYNFLILEDDPYYFLSYSDDIPKSFLSMDSERRVLRLDSFSKIVSPGLRLGFVTGPKEVLEKMICHLQSSSIHPSGLSQVIIHELMKQWQHNGFMQHVKEVKMFYQRNRDIMLQAIDTHLKGLVDYIVPSAGFFLWLRLKFIRDSKIFVQKCLENLILVTSGDAFYEQDDKMTSSIRLSFSAIDEDQIDHVISTLATLIREEMADKK